MNVVLRKPRFVLSGMVTIALISACSSAPKVRVDQDSRTNFSAYKSYSWLEAKQSESTDAKPADAKPQVGTLSAQRVHSSIASVLQTKGYARDESRPDVRVNYVLTVYERPRQSGLRIGLGAGGGSGNVAGGVGLSVPVGRRTETVAMMTIDVVDAARNAQVWTGSFESLLKGKDASDEDVQKLVETILAKYPGRAN